MIFSDANIIYEAINKAIKGSRKSKHDTQLFQVNKLLYTAMLQKDLQRGTYTPKQGKKFLLSERGKKRFISNNCMVDKVVNHIICDNVLTPAMEKNLICDNSASRKNKGVVFHRKRFESALRNFYKKFHTNDGYILLGDFSGYYANIRHDKALNIIKKNISRSDVDVADKKNCYEIIKKIFANFRLDVSRFSDSEVLAMYKQEIDGMMNYGIDEKLLTGKKFLDKGVDIGSQISQCIGVMFMHDLDFYIKAVKGIKYYGRYSDDFYVIAKDKDTLTELLTEIKAYTQARGVSINEKKTRICKLSEFFRHLQHGYKLTETGKLIIKINPKAITRERRRLKAYRKLLEKNKITYSDVKNYFKSWLCGNYKIMARWQINNMLKCYEQIFGRVLIWKKKHSRLRYLMGHK